MRIVLVLASIVFLALSAGCGPKNSGPLAPDETLYAITSMPPDGYLTAGDPTGDDAPYRGRYWKNRARNIMLWEGPEGYLYELDYPCGFMGPLPPGHGSDCGGQVYYTPIDIGGE